MHSIKAINLPFRDLLGIVLLSGFYFLGLGNVHLFDWDEINFAESAREMLETGNYLSVQINYIPFWEKPPLFFWMQALSMKIFGVNEFAARFPNALFGLFYLVTIYLMGMKLTHCRLFSWLWVVLYFGSFLPHIYFKSGIIDPVFNFFIFLSVYFTYRAFKYKGIITKYALWAGLFSGLSFLTKGPVGFLLLFCTLILSSFLSLTNASAGKPGHRFAHYFKSIRESLSSLHFWRSTFIFFVGFFSVIFIWLGAEVYYHGFDILLRFVKYQIELFTTPVAGHGQPFYYHFVVILIGCFPMSIWGIPNLWPRKQLNEFDFALWMISLFWVVMIIFSISTTKILHYSSMTYLPLSFLAAKYINERIENNSQINKYLLVLYIFFGLLLSILFTGFFYLINHPEIFIPMVQDEAAKVALAMPMNWTGYEPAIGLFFLVGWTASLIFILKKKWLISVLIISLSTGTTLLGVSYFILPGVERFSQGAAIEFYQSIEREDAYVETVGFKSYAQYFYKKTKPGGNPNRFNKDWLIQGDIDKDVYFVTKVNNSELDGKEGIQKLRCEGGFCFYVRRRLD